MGNEGSGISPQVAEAVTRRLFIRLFPARAADFRITQCRYSHGDMPVGIPFASVEGILTNNVADMS